MIKIINAPPISEQSLKVFCMAFRFYNEIYSRNIELSDNDLNQIFERIHAKALEVYDYEIWDSLETDGNKFWYSDEPDKEYTFPLNSVLVNYGHAILEDRFPELAYPKEPDKATVEIFLFFIYAYVRSMESRGNKTMYLPPELLPYAIDPLVNYLGVHEKDLHDLNNLSVALIIDILSLNNRLNQADKLEGLYNNPALNKIWGKKSDDTMVGLIMLDGDKFKQVNDNCGHGVGNEVLEIYRDSILNAIELSIKPKIKVFPARWGGEEFCVCVFDTNEEEIICLSKKIKSELESHKKWEELKEREYEEMKEQIDFPRTFSQGIALGKKSDFKYLNALVEIADKQMYMAKNEGGRNCIYYKDIKV
jgi:diguanylate cyclase (GGDEF)-like protein